MSNELNPLSSPPGSQDINLLAVIVCPDERMSQLTQRLNKNQFPFTRIDNSGGLWGFATVSLLVGINRNRLNQLMDLLNSCCKTRLEYIPAHIELPLSQGSAFMIEAEMSGAIVYAFEVDQFEQL